MKTRTPSPKNKKPYRLTRGVVAQKIKGIAYRWSGTSPRATSDAGFTIVGCFSVLARIY